MKLISVNIGRFPDYLRPYVKQKEISLKQAIPEISKRLKATEADVICLQELWTGQKKMAQALSDVYPYSFLDTRCGRYLVGFHSGMAIFSKKPLTKLVLEDYKIVRGDEGLAKKGIMGVEVEDWLIFTTHGNAGDGNLKNFFAKIPLIGNWLNKKILHLNRTYSEVARAQWQQGHDVISRFTDKNKKTVYVGDFNVSSECEEMFDTLDARDTFDHGKSPRDGQQSADPRPRIDLLLDINNSVSGYSILEDILPYPYADHLTIIGYLS